MFHDKGSILSHTKKDTNSREIRSDKQKESKQHQSLALISNLQDVILLFCYGCICFCIAFEMGNLGCSGCSRTGYTTEEDLKHIFFPILPFSLCGAGIKPRTLGMLVENVPN